MGKGETVYEVTSQLMFHRARTGVLCAFRESVCLHVTQRNGGTGDCPRIPRHVSHLDTPVERLGAVMLATGLNSTLCAGLGCVSGFLNGHVSVSEPYSRDLDSLADTCER